MPLYLENYGLSFFGEDDDTFSGFVAQILRDGDLIVGYYGLPYVNYHFGDVQMIARTERAENEGHLEVIGIDSHVAGRAVWNVRLHGANLKRDDEDRLTKRVLASKPDGSGAAVVNIVNADVLPSFKEGELITLQVAVFPELIGYYADEDEYAETQPDFHNGKKLLLEEGVVFPGGLLQNRNPNNPEFGKNDDMDDINQIRGKVKSLQRGRFQIGEKTYYPYIVSTIDTQYGDLEIIHTIDQVKEAQRGNIKEGAVVDVLGVISGDAAIREYENGIVRDEEHDLTALCYMFAGGDPERLRSVLTENTVYTAEYNHSEYIGADEIIKRFRYVQKTHKGNYFARLATITEIDGGDGSGASLKYGVGKRCVVLSSDEETDYESIAFIDIDDDGRIIRLVTSVDARYHFLLDERPEKKSLLDEVDLPKSVVEPILLRAHFFEIIDHSISDEAILGDTDYSWQYQNNIHQMLNAMPETEEQYKRMYTENLFGYLFAKAVEMEYSENHQETLSGYVCGYEPSEAWEGVITSGLDEDRQRALEKAMDTGKLFFNDFAFFMQDNPAESYEDNLTRALMLTQILGRLYSRQCLNW